MWLLFHRNAKTRPVRDGNAFVETCPECNQRAKFVEVEITESFGLFFVDLVGDKDRAYRCSACGETFDLKDQLPAGRTPPARELAAAPPVKSAAQIVREQEAEAARRREAAEARANRIDDELAELKRRMGK